MKLLLVIICVAIAGAQASAPTFVEWRLSTPLSTSVAFDHFAVLPSSKLAYDVGGYPVTVRRYSFETNSIDAQVTLPEGNRYASKIRVDPQGRWAFFTTQYVKGACGTPEPNACNWGINLWRLNVATGALEGPADLSVNWGGYGGGSHVQISNSGNTVFVMNARNTPGYQIMKTVDAATLTVVKTVLIMEYFAVWYPRAWTMAADDSVALTHYIDPYGNPTTLFLYAAGGTSRVRADQVPERVLMSPDGRTYYAYGGKSTSTEQRITLTKHFVNNGSKLAETTFHVSRQKFNEWQASGEMLIDPIDPAYLWIVNSARNESTATINDAILTKFRAADLSLVERVYIPGTGEIQGAAFIPGGGGLRISGENKIVEILRFPTSLTFTVRPMNPGATPYAFAGLPIVKSNANGLLFSNLEFKSSLVRLSDGAVLKEVQKDAPYYLDRGAVLAMTADYAYVAANEVADKKLPMRQISLADLQVAKSVDVRYFGSNYASGDGAASWNHWEAGITLVRMSTMEAKNALPAPLTLTLWAKWDGGDSLLGVGVHARSRLLYGFVRNLVSGVVTTTLIPLPDNTTVSGSRGFVTSKDEQTLLQILVLRNDITRVSSACYLSTSLEPSTLFASTMLCPPNGAYVLSTIRDPEDKSVYVGSGEFKRLWYRPALALESEVWVAPQMDGKSAVVDDAKRQIIFANTEAPASLAVYNFPPA